MSKRQLREKISAAIANMSDSEKQSASEKVVRNFVGLGLKAKRVCIYNALASEVDTSGLIEYFEGKAEIFMPVVRDDEMMLVRYDKNGDFVKGAFGIQEPCGKEISARQADVDICITPMVAGDRKLNRLGKGKGYYDRFFGKCRCIKVGICFDCQLVDEIDADEWDVRMDYIVSDKEIVK
ncbi:MAG: 5-formyltetrahydrofolate cyclo-ligase [Christensenellales bacterium]